MHYNELWVIGTLLLVSLAFCIVRITHYRNICLITTEKYYQNTLTLCDKTEDLLKSFFDTSDEVCALYRTFIDGNLRMIRRNLEMITNAQYRRIIEGKLEHLETQLKICDEYHEHLKVVGIETTDITIKGKNYLPKGPHLS